MNKESYSKQCLEYSLTGKPKLPKVSYPKWMKQAKKGIRNDNI